MEIARGILIDAKGNFLGAFQWDASKPQPQFNLPRQGQNGVLPADLKTLLAESVAEEGMEFKRWDFKNEVWVEPTEKGWLVDGNGGLRGSKRYFADQIPNIPVGWILTNKAPLRTPGQRSYFDLVADEWKFPLQLARVENDTLMNFECIRDDFVAPPEVEYIDRPNRLDGTPAIKGDVRDGNGDWPVPIIP